MSDQRSSRLEEEIFSMREAKDGKVMIFWRGKLAKTLKGKEAQKFLARVEGLDSYNGQLAMAKITGQFKFGNEGLAKDHQRNQ